MMLGCYHHTSLDKHDCFSDSGTIVARLGIDKTIDKKCETCNLSLWFREKCDCGYCSFNRGLVPHSNPTSSKGSTLDCTCKRSTVDHSFKNGDRTSDRCPGCNKLTFYREICPCKDCTWLRRFMITGDKVRRKKYGAQHVPVGSVGEVVGINSKERVKVDWGDRTDTYHKTDSAKALELVDEKLEDSRDELTINVPESLKNLEETLAASIILQKDTSAKFGNQIEDLQKQLNREKAFNVGVRTGLKERLTKLEEKPLLPKLVRCIITKQGPWVIVPFDPEIDDYLPKGMVCVFKGKSDKIKIKDKKVPSQYAELVFKDALEDYPKDTNVVAWLFLGTIVLTIGACINEIIHLAL